MSHSTLLKLKNIEAILNPESETNWGSLARSNIFAWRQLSDYSSR